MLICCLAHKIKVPIAHFRTTPTSSSSQYIHIHSTAVYRAPVGMKVLMLLFG